jgi:methionyl-tRNA synthetase
MAKGIDKQLHRFLLNITNRCNSLIEYRSDKDLPERKKIITAEDQALVKYNEAEAIIMRDAYERCSAR